MTPTDYSANLRDTRFVLFEQIKVQDLCKLEKYQDFDQETFDAMLVEAVKMSENDLHALRVSGDQEGCRYIPETKEVQTPKGYKELFKKFVAAGWAGAGGDPEYGGMGLPPIMGSAFGEYFAGGNVSFSLYGLLNAGSSDVISKYGCDEMKAKYLPSLYAGDWGSTMVLTEPGAGSDVGNSKSKAIKDEEGGFYRISGDKIFITGGDHDLAHNIIHLVLARCEGAPKGTKGLSLFLVPKYRLNDDGSDGEFNQVYCTGIEHKMGIKASATCSLSFGDEGDCRGWIIGNEGDGMRIMFNFMNLARIETGVAGMAQASGAYFNALAYAKERLQGSALKDFKNADAPRVPIIEHPDVRRMLLWQKAFVEGCRYILLKAGMYESLSHAAETEEDRVKNNGFLELLTPICKAYCSDRAFEVCSEAMQVYGGYGYTAEYPVEQYTRDVRILPIYEGANGIQAMDLLGRKLGMKKGMVLMSYIEEITAGLDTWKDNPRLKDMAELYEAAKDEWINVAMTLSMMGMAGKFINALLSATPFLKLMGHVVAAYGLLEQAAIADEWLEKRFAAEGIGDDKKARRAFVADKPEVQFYYGKVVTAQFFIKNVLPEVYSISKGILTEDRSPMEPIW